MSAAAQACADRLAASLERVGRVTRARGLIGCTVRENRFRVFGPTEKAMNYRLNVRTANLLSSWLRACDAGARMRYPSEGRFDILCDGSGFLRIRLVGDREELPGWTVLVRVNLPRRPIDYDPVEAAYVSVMRVVHGL